MTSEREIVEAARVVDEKWDTHGCIHVFTEQVVIQKLGEARIVEVRGSGIGIEFSSGVLLGKDRGGIGVWCSSRLLLALLLLLKMLLLVVELYLMLLVLNRHLLLLL